MDEPMVVVRVEVGLSYHIRSALGAGALMRMGPTSSSVVNPYEVPHCTDGAQGLLTDRSRHCRVRR
jgi:hypothetical protein